MQHAVRWCVGLAAAIVCAMPAGAQSPAKPAINTVAPASHTQWADVAKWPDFTTGTWDPPGFVAPDRLPGAAGPPVLGPPPEARPDPNLLAPMTSELAKRVKAAKALSSAGGSGTTSCEPMGILNYSGTKFYFTKDVILLTGVANSSIVLRHIYLNRAQHGDPDPSYFGDSIGHWEGGTLVVDTTAIRAEAQFVSGVPINSNATHVTERFRLTGPDTLELVKTVDNPEIFTKPWVSTQIIHRLHGDDPIESYCWMDREAYSGLRAPDLTPP